MVARRLEEAGLVTTSISLIREHTEMLKPPRALWDWSRRDLFMLAMGAVGALAAVGLGYGLAQVVKKKDEEKK